VKKKILAVSVAVAVLAAILVVALPANAAVGVLDHAQITPTSATVPVGGPVQFLAQGYDDGNSAITTPLTYQWTVSGGGTISAAGLFTGTTSGKFSVQVTVTQGTISKTATANIKVTANSSAAPIANLETKKLASILDSYLNSIGFSNFLGGQWQVKNGTGTDTIQAIAGVVQTVSNTTSGTTLTILANGQTTPTPFTLTSSTVILPKGTQLTSNDNVVVVTVNNQVTIVIKFTPGTTSEQVPPGWRNNNRNGCDKQMTPLGWSHGGKVGWNNGDDSEGNED